MHSLLMSARAACLPTLLYWTVERRFMEHSSALSLVAALDRNASFE